MLESDHWPEMPIIVISGHQFRSASGRGPDFLYMATKLGAVSSLQKPFRPNELLAAVAESLTVSSSRPSESAQSNSSPD
jgi:FixJ family two-component response regulator